MTYFRDLTPYQYCGNLKDVLNIGWLSAEHPFPKGDTPSGLADALAICAQRPENLCRGCHRCDLCSAPNQRDEWTTYELSGRILELGNGEIRVTDSKGITYSAPTMVAHYVEAHQYLPPASFIEAVMISASKTFVIHGKLFEQIQDLNLKQRYRICFAVFEAASAHKGQTLEPSALQILQETETALDSPLESLLRKQSLAMLESLAPDHKKEEALSFLFYCATWFLMFADFVGANDKELAVHRVAIALEGGFDAGLSIKELEAYVEAVQ
jgi:hypothetical protein